MSKGLILTDCIENDRDIFLKELTDKSGITFENMFINTARWQKGLLNILRFLSYVFVPIYVLIMGKKYEYIVSWQQFYGLFYAFWCDLFQLKKKKKLIIMTFIYKEKKGNIGKIYARIIRSIVRSGYIDAFICYSEMECEKYANVFNVDKKLFYPCKLNIDDSYDEFKELIQQGDYYLAAGRSNRDYNFLCGAFEQFSNRKLIIICDRFKPDKSYDNITILNDTYGDDYFKYLAGSRAVLVPLNNDVEVSSGQMVAIHGMMFGKIVIATENRQMKEYINHGENGFLICNNKKELSDILDYIENNDMEAVTKKARESYISNFCEDKRSFLIADLIKR